MDSLVERIKLYLQQLAPHAAEREGAALLREAIPALSAPLSDEVADMVKRIAELESKLAKGYPQPPKESSGSIRAMSEQEDKTDG